MLQEKEGREISREISGEKVNRPRKDDWYNNSLMSSIIEYLSKGTLPSNKGAARKIRR